MYKKIKMESLMIIQKYNPRIYGKNYTYWFPISYGYLIAAMRKAGHSVECLNLNHCVGVKKPVSDKLNKKKYDFVFLGGDTRGYNIFNLIISEIRKHKSKPKIVLGGPILTSEPEIIFNSLDADFGVIGEGEEIVVELLDGKDLNKIKGLVHRKNGKSIFNEARKPIEDLDSLPFPEYDDMGYKIFLDNMKPSYSYFYSTFDNPRAYSIIGSRSCHYQCTFCWNHGNYRERSVENIMKEMEFILKKYKINMFYLLDECVAINKERLIKICKGINELRKKTEWEIRWICTIRVDVVTPEILKLLKESGCWMVSYGLESYSSEVLKSMKKGITPEQVKKALEDTMKAKLAIQGAFIFGDVVETEETAKTTLDFWSNKCKGQFNLGLVQPWPNSEIYQHCIKKGLIKNRLDFLKKLVDLGDDSINMTDKMTDKQFKKMTWNIFKAIGKNRRIILPSLIKTDKNIYTIRAKCPFCAHVGDYGNYMIKNTFSYNYGIFCRGCGMRFYATSSFNKLMFRHFAPARILKKIKLRVKKEIAWIKNRYQKQKN